MSFDLATFGQGAYFNGSINGYHLLMNYSNRT